MRLRRSTTSGPSTDTTTARFYADAGSCGQTVWMSPQDAEKIGVRDSEVDRRRTANGTVSWLALLSPTASRRRCSCAAPRILSQHPLNEESPASAAVHNSLTRIFIK